MPTYRYNPPKESTNLITYFNVYDPISHTKEDKKVLVNEEFYTDRYFDKNILEKAHLEFISDSPYISPIVISYSGSKEKTIEVPDYSNLIDIYVSLKTSKSSFINLYFNGDKNNMISIYSSGKIFRNISVSKIRTITTIPNDNCEYTIALVDADQFAGNNTGEQAL